MGTEPLGLTPGQVWPCTAGVHSPHPVSRHCEVPVWGYSTCSGSRKHCRFLGLPDLATQNL